MNLLRYALVAISLTAAILSAGCANPGPVQDSDDTYLLSRTDKAGVFGNASAMKAQVMQDAVAFAASQGKAAEVVSVHETALLVGQRFASIDYRFRLVEKGH